MPVLVDTSVWVQHFRRGEPDLQILISNDDEFFVADLIPEGSQKLAGGR